MEYHDNERGLTTPARQQAIQAWESTLVDNTAFAEPVSPTLALVGLGKAATYLEMHPEHLTAALASSDWRVRTAAVRTVGKQGDRAPLELLMAALHDEHVSVRAMAARALGLQEKRLPAEPLVMALHDPEWRVRAAAVLALGRFKNRTPVEPLLPLMNDEHPSVRAAVVWALGRLGKQVSIEQLVTALHDKAWPVREAAIMALKEQGERAPIAPLLEARWDEESSVRQAAETALDYRFEEQPGQKLVPESRSQSPSSWLRLVVAALSVLLLIPLANSLLGGSGYISRFDTISKLIALAVVCLAISITNFIYQRKGLGIWSRQRPVRPGSSGSASSWQGALLVVLSVGALLGIANTLLNSALPDSLGITADTLNFISICRLVALGWTSLTVVVINTVFHLKRS